MDDANLRKLRADVVRKRDELDAVIKYFDGLIGAPDESASTSDGPSSFVPSNPNGDADLLSFVSKSEFVGLSSMKATVIILERIEARTGVRRHFRVPELYEALLKGGCAPSKKEGLYTTVARASALVNVGQGHWGLAKWHPSIAKKPRTTSGSAVAAASTSESSDDEGGGEADGDD